MYLPVQKVEINMADLLTYQQKNDIGINEWTCDELREAYLACMDYSRTDLTERCKGITLKVAYYSPSDYENPIYGHVFFFEYQERFFVSQYVFRSEEYALKTGKEAIDKLLEILF